jgi:hypothetical protein
MQGRLAAALAAICEEFAVEGADSPPALGEAYQFRYQAYCLERGYETAAGDIETDHSDDRAHQVVVRHRASGSARHSTAGVGVARRRSRRMLPMQQVSNPHAIQRLPLQGMAEASRCVLSRVPHAPSPASRSLLRLSLMRGALLANIHGPTHLCTLVEPSLHRLPCATGIHFNPAGSPVEHHGIRQLIVCRVDELLDRLRPEQSVVWGCITDNGRRADCGECQGRVGQTRLPPMDCARGHGW